MNSKSEITRELPLVADNQWLLDQLTESSNSPHDSLIAIVGALDAPDAQLGLWLIGLPDDEIQDDPDTIRAFGLTPLQYEHIKSFEEVLKIMCTHSDMNPTEIGDWLGDGSMQDLHFKKPVDLLFHDFSLQGFDRQAIGLFAAAARPHIPVDDEQYQALWGTWLD